MSTIDTHYENKLSKSMVQSDDLGGVLYHAPRRGLLPTVGWAHEGDVWVIPPGREAQATKVVGDELKTPKVNGFVEGKAIAYQTFIVSGDDKRRWGNHQNTRGKTCYKSPFLARQLSVLSASANYRVVKIVRSSSEVALRTMKHTMIYPCSDSSSEAIALHPMV
jgi:hypothetical protein